MNEVLLQVEDSRGLPHLPLDLIAGSLGQPERECHVLPHRHVRIERVVLKDHRDVAVPWPPLVDDLAIDLELAGSDVLKPGDEPQGRRLARTRRADQDHEFAVSDLEVHVPHGLETVPISLPDVLEEDLGHRLPPQRAAALVPSRRRPVAGAAIRVLTPTPSWPRGRPPFITAVSASRRF
jgi:hypothetical protein